MIAIIYGISILVTSIICLIDLGNERPTISMACQAASGTDILDSVVLTIIGIFWAIYLYLQNTSSTETTNTPLITTTDNPPPFSNNTPDDNPPNNDSCT